MRRQQQCLANAIQTGGCYITDIACQCGANQAAIGAAAAPCLTSSCTNPDDFTKAVNVGLAQCAEFNSKNNNKNDNGKGNSNNTNTATPTYGTNKTTTVSPTGTGSVHPSSTNDNVSVGGAARGVAPQIGGVLALAVGLAALL